VSFVLSVVVIFSLLHPVISSQDRVVYNGFMNQSSDQTKPFSLSGNIVDLLHGRVYPGTVRIEKGRISGIDEDRGTYPTYLIPGFVDAHIHIESSMLTPAEFGRMASVHGTVACVADPHEIANVMGMAGVQYMLEDSVGTPFKLFFGAPSCVPATPFETSGAVLGPREVSELLARDDIRFLSEVMNYPGVIGRDPSLMKKIDAARALGKRIDGHAPGLRGKALADYISAGIETDHETLDLDEALEKISLGMKILIREGSAARDFDKLEGLLDGHGNQCMFCCDDLHPDDLVRSHIDSLVRRAIGNGHDPLNILRCACLNPVLHYDLPVGLLREGDPADFLVADDLKGLNILKTYIGGNLVAEMGRPLSAHAQSRIVNIFHSLPKAPEDFRIRSSGGPANIMEAYDGQLCTGWLKEPVRDDGGFALTDPAGDILKIVVVNRYRDSPPAAGFVKGFGLRHGAMASSVAHDSHNIVAVGVSDTDICHAVNLLIEHKGGLAVAGKDFREYMPLPVAGLMSDQDGWKSAASYSRLQESARGLGSQLKAPFITLSFMALPVIPKLKMTDRGLFDAEAFQPVEVFSTS
jgi:adenine deaminase